MAHSDETLRIKKIEAEIANQERLIALLSERLGSPIWYHSGKQHVGFRYLKPDWKHFCLLKAVRAVSGLNACLKLIEGGFSQEICVLLRTIVESTSHIDFVVAGVSDGDLSEEQAKYVNSYFADFKRNEVSDFGRPGIRQQQVHKAVGAEMDLSIKNTAEAQAFARVDSAKLMSNVYLTLSNYVHARYPETMDLYGGDPAHFHLAGMRGTPKDFENLDAL